MEDLLAIKYIYDQINLKEVLLKRIIYFLEILTNLNKIFFLFQ